MDKHNYKYTATITLAVTTLLFFISYPFVHTFWGGLAASAFSAAMIGGFADWFAVTALFRRPLMIPFRTAIIPNNRDRIFAAIINMVEKELLTSENIKQSLANAQLSQEIINHLCLSETKNHFQNLALNITGELLKNLDPDKAGYFLAGLFRDRLNEIKLSPIIGQALSWSIRKGFIDQGIDIIIGECQQLFAKDYIKNIFISIYRNAQESYTGQLLRRKLFRFIIENFLQLTPEKAAELAQEKLADYLARMKNTDSSHRRKIKASLVKLAANLQENPEYDAQIEKWKQNFLSHPRLAATFGKIILSFTDRLSKNPAQIEKFLTKAGDELSFVLVENSDLKNQLDLLLINGLSKWVNKHHSEIGAMVSLYLSSWSNEKLVYYIESKVGNDLQMIRINGSIVGGLTGLALYLITFCLGF